MGGVDEINNVGNDDVGRDVYAIDSDVALLDLDVHIGCHECIHIPDDVCLKDGAVEFDDEQVDVADVECEVKC